MESRRARAPIERTLPAWLPARFVDEAEAWPLRRGLLALGDEAAFPSVERWSPLLAAAGLPDPGVRFERQAPRPRRRGRGLGASGSVLPGYDASIVERGVVPSREGSWHDLLNCLVWHAFPRSKAVLHRRQLAAQRAEEAAGDGVAVNGERASGRPGQPPGVARGDAAVGRPRGAHARSPHRDALALLGHALHEQRQRGAAVVTALLLAADGGEHAARRRHDRRHHAGPTPRLPGRRSDTGTPAGRALGPRAGGVLTPPRSAPPRAPVRPA